MSTQPTGGNRTAWAVAAAGLGLLLIGLGVLARPDDEPRVEVAAGSDVAVTGGPSGAFDPLAAWSSPALVANPTDADQLVTVARVERPQLSAGLSRSSDGGATWTAVALPVPPGQGRVYAPDVAFDAVGGLHVAYATLSDPENNPTGLWLARSADSGASFSAPVAVSGPYGYQPQVTTGSGRVHVSFVQATAAVETVSNGFGPPPNPVQVATSVDSGASFAAPVTVSPPARARVGGATPVVGAGGGLFVLYSDYGDDSVDLEGQPGGIHQGRFSLVVARSADGGASFSEAGVVDDALVPAARFNPYTPPHASLAADPEVDTLYAAWSDARSGSPEVYVRRSDDAGASWTAAVVVDSPGGSPGGGRYLPVVSVAVGGRVDVAYLDGSRSDPGAHTTAALATSFDFGASFHAIAISTKLFDATVGPDAVGGGTDPGSFLGLVSTPTSALAVWPDTRAGTADTGRRDLYFAPVTIGPER
ncbi:MAG: sialidase family protein [Acidimicrobiales bacterium]